ncbi:MAG: ABC-type transport auxiliary lipoprotein family protein [Legionellaceae bacterium]|nr:ABC-type transport auxiliary lipoprotein family protein [Legionellaceae bacterium]
MNKLIVVLLCLLTACTPVKSPIRSQYKIVAFSAKTLETTVSSQSILIAQPDAMAGYETEQMLYTDQPFQLSSFAHSSWISPPANMLTSLITQSLQHSHYFYAVAAGPNADKTDYRLDTQLLTLQQNFLTKPSTLEFSVQIVLTRVNDNRVIASHTFVERVPCPADTPYGGVIATNKATQAFTARLTAYVVKQVKHDLH